jgi:prepilin-type N-terminal cleavage/methylation domain-containing protein
LGNRGFSLLELIIVVTVIGVLAAIAIPQFEAYRQRGFDSSALTDLHSAATAEEGLFASNGAYVSCRNASCDQRLPGFHRSGNVNMRMRRASASFTGTSTHTNGTGRAWSYDSSAGGLQ